MQEKKVITNEEVINEFKEIKNTSTGGLIFIIIVLILALGASIYYIYTLKKDNNETNYPQEEITNKENQNTDNTNQEVSKEDIVDNSESKEEQNTDNSENLEIEEITNETSKEGKTGHILDSTVGNFIILPNGDVYYESDDTIYFSGTEIKISKTTLSVLGTKKKYISKIYQKEPESATEGKGCTFEAYKLDLNNISSAYEIYQGNGGFDISIIFLSYDGSVSALNFTQKISTDEIKISLNKNISKYSNIVSVVTNMSYGGHGAMLIDKDGNKYQYEVE